MRIFAVGSEARMPGDPSTLENGGICVVQSVMISRIEPDTDRVLVTPRVRYMVGVPTQTFFSEFGEELLATDDSRFLPV
jgi:hypothetical protein